MAGTRGPQVVLEGYARTVARGGAGKTMRDNIQAMDGLVSAGLTPDGNTVDGRTRTGAPTYDHVIAQFPREELSKWEIPAPLLNGGGSSSIVNVIDYGADPNGLLDSSAAFRAALATGKATYVPAGTYRLLSSVTVGNGSTTQRLYGDGDGSVLMIDADFDPTATTGVINVYPTSGQYFVSAQIEGLRFSFKQPNDIFTTAAVAATVGATTITVASAAGIRVGQCVVVSGANGAALSNALANAGTPFRLVTVTGIAGTVISLSGAVAAPGVSAGDTLYFGMTRATMAPLGAGTTTPGGTGVRYPWAIYSTTPGTKLDNITVGGAWNGIYLRRAAVLITRIYIGAMNIGFDFDQSFNAAFIDEYFFYSWGFDNTSVPGIGIACHQSFYDGTTIAANLGEMDGGSIGRLISFTGLVNITSTFTWGHINTLALDGNQANLVVLGGTGGNPWLMIGQFYKTAGPGQNTPAILINTPHPTFSVRISYAAVICIGSAPAIQVVSGGLEILGGIINVSASSPVISCAGANAKFSNVTFAGNAGQTFIQHTAGSLQVTDCRFNTDGTGCIGISLTDDVNNIIQGVALNNWNVVGVPATAPLGTYIHFVKNTWHVMSDGTNEVKTILDGPAGVERFVQVWSGGVNRWKYGGTGSAESGGNAGTDFAIINYADDGSALAVPFAISRQTGRIVLAALATSAGYANDAAAAAAGVPIGGAYRNGSVVQVRVT